MKYFISQVMRKRSNEEVIRERKEVHEVVKQYFPDAEQIESFVPNISEDDNPLWYLGKAIQMLSFADVCIFVDDAQTKTRGCKIEYDACMDYGIPKLWYHSKTKTITDKFEREV